MDSNGLSPFAPSVTEKLIKLLMDAHDRYTQPPKDLVNQILADLELFHPTSVETTMMALIVEDAVNEMFKKTQASGDSTLQECVSNADQEGAAASGTKLLLEEAFEITFQSLQAEINFWRSDLPE